MIDNMLRPLLGMFTECTSKILAKNTQKHRTEKPNTDKRQETQF